MRGETAEPSLTDASFDEAASLGAVVNPTACAQAVPRFRGYEVFVAALSSVPFGPDMPTTALITRHALVTWR